MFSPDAVCGITPIEEMLEINDIEPRVRKSRAARPNWSRARSGAGEAPVGPHLPLNGLTGEFRGAPLQSQTMVPIESPLLFSGFTQSTLGQFGPMFHQLGYRRVEAGGRGRDLKAISPRRVGSIR